MRKWLLVFVMATLALSLAVPGIVVAQDAGQGDQGQGQSQQGGQAQQGQNQLAYLRLIDLSFDAPGLNVWVNGAPSNIQALSFGEVSGWIEMSPNTYAIALMPIGGGAAQASASQSDQGAVGEAQQGQTGQGDQGQVGQAEQSQVSALIGPIRYTLNAGQWTTLAIVGSAEDGSLTVQVLRENYAPLSDNTARVGFLNALHGAPNVDVVLSDGSTVAQNLIAAGSAGSANASFAEFDLDAGTYTLCALPSLQGAAAGADQQSQSQALTVVCPANAATAQSGADQSQASAGQGDQGAVGQTQPSANHRLVLAETGSITLQPRAFYLIAVFGTVDNPVVKVIETTEATLAQNTNATFGGATGQPQGQGDQGQVGQTDQQSQGDQGSVGQSQQGQSEQALTGVRPGDVFAPVYQQFQAALDLFTQAAQLQQGGDSTTTEANLLFDQALLPFDQARQQFEQAQGQLGDQSGDVTSAVNDFSTALTSFANALSQGPTDQFSTSLNDFQTAFQSFQSSPALQG